MENFERIDDLAKIWVNLDVEDKKTLVNELFGKRIFKVDEDEPKEVVKTFEEKAEELRDSLPWSNQLLSTCKVSNYVVDDFIPEIIEAVKSNSSYGKLITECLSPRHLSDNDKRYVEQFFTDRGYSARFVTKKDYSVVWDYIVVEVY